MGVTQMNRMNRRNKETSEFFVAVSGRIDSQLTAETRCQIASAPRPSGARGRS